MNTPSTINTAAKVIQETRNKVASSTGYRSHFPDTRFPEVSAFVRIMEQNLLRAGARLVESCDPEHPLDVRRKLPDGDWPYSIWHCADESVAVVYEDHGESASDPAHLLRYKPQLFEGMESTVRYAGNWDGQTVQSLAHALQSAAARIHGGEHELTMEDQLLFQLIEVPFTERIADTHPFHKLGIIHGIDEHNSLLMSSELVGTLFVVPGELTALEVARHQADVASKAAATSGPGKYFGAYHKDCSRFFDQAIKALKQDAEQRSNHLGRPDQGIDQGVDESENERATRKSPRQGNDPDVSMAPARTGPTMQ